MRFTLKPSRGLQVVAAMILLALRVNAENALTEVVHLSGRGPKDAVPWDFQIRGGRRSGEEATLPVPSNWELHGFGDFTYGQEADKAPETGFYRRTFSVPEGWSGRRVHLVFNGVMIDARVKVNGLSAGPVHIGGFYPFKYDITRLLKRQKGAENVLEVEVAKTSSSAEAQLAEQSGDYWVFGGIFRPVWLEASPARSIEHVAIDARADGGLTADLTLGFHGPVRLDGPRLPSESVVAQVVDAAGRPVGEPVERVIPHGGIGRLRIATQIRSPALWTAETPHLYTLRVMRKSGDEVTHTVTRRFGFRTFEVRDGEGLFLNGRRILLKGVNRHSFRTDTGRALDPEDCREDLRLIKGMNLNAARMAHYPPDEAFLDACDEVGLYVINELAGWQKSQSTEVGRRLVREMVESSVNHPSVLFWTNGNEGGWNRDLDGDFALYDPQQRRVLHPWDPFSGIDTRHYPSHDELMTRLKGPHLVMPTEFMHSLFDGGGGAGLKDAWSAITGSPVGAGGFIWMLADEGVRRSDRNGRLDVFGTYAADGIVGPRHEKEGSYHAVREVWSPVQIARPVIDEAFTGRLEVSNHHDFTPLEKCRFEWSLLQFPGPMDIQAGTRILAGGMVPSPEVPPHSHGVLAVPLPADWRGADALAVAAFGPDGHELWTWVWPLPGIERRSVAETGGGKPRVETSVQEVRLIAGDLTAAFDASSGLLKGIRRGNQGFALSNGPRLVFARPEVPDAVEWLPFASEDPASGTHRLAKPLLASTVEVELEGHKSVAYALYRLEISSDGVGWRTVFDGSCREGDLKRCNFARQRVLAIRVSNARGNAGGVLAVKSVRLGDVASSGPPDPAPAVALTTGTGGDDLGGPTRAWLESRGAAGLKRFRWALSGGGALELDYEYTMEGDFLHHGISFDHPEERMKSLRWLGDGPCRVWQNRPQGTRLGIHETVRNETQTGESWDYPEFQGFFSGLRWANLETTAGRLSVSSAHSDIYLRVGTPRVSHRNTTVVFPGGDLSFLHAIPAIGSKVHPPERAGPGGVPARAGGTCRGRLTFRFSPAPQVR